MKKKMFFCLLFTLCMAATFADREIGRNARTSTYADSVEAQSPMPMPSSLQWNWHDLMAICSRHLMSRLISLPSTTQKHYAPSTLPFQHGGQGLADDELTVIYAEYDRGNDGIAGTPFWDTFYFIRLDDGTFLGIGTREQDL